MGNFLSVAVAVGVPLAAGLGLGLAIQDDVKGWYKQLRKPSWTPPDWLFGPVWTALYTAMGYASYLVWQNGGGTLPLSLYGVQLILNLAWSPLFFRKHEIGFALLDLTALLGVLGATIVEFNKVSPTAAYLMLPYLAWSAYATALTADVYKKNPQARGKQSEKARKQVEDAASAAADKASELADKAQGKSHSAADKAESTAKDVKDKAESGAKDVRDKTESGAKDARDKAESGAKDVRDKSESGAKDAKNKADAKFA